jgi:hypothetical protein
MGAMPGGGRGVVLPGLVASVLLAHCVLAVADPYGIPPRVRDQISKVSNLSLRSPCRGPAALAPSSWTPRSLRRLFAEDPDVQRLQRPAARDG